MSLTVGTRTTTATGAALVAVGLALSAHGVLHDNGVRTMAGAVLVVAALFGVLLVLTHRWMTDTRGERRRLALATERAHEKEATFFALEAAHEAEMTRMHRDIVAERAQNAATLVAEREAMYAQFEKDRLQIETKAFQTGVLFERAGMLEPEAPQPSNIISFPQPTPGAMPQQERSHERSREHGGVAP